MRTWERLTKLRAWLYEELCKGRELKCPVPRTGKGGLWAPDITDFTYTEPRVFLAWQPLRPDEPGKADSNDPYSVCPAITVMPTASHARYEKEQRFDRYNNVHRPQDMGKSLSVQLLFAIYEPGVRYPGFAEGLDGAGPDMSLIKDGTDAGLQTLVEWMDDAMELLLRYRCVPHTDLYLDDDAMFYSLYSDQNFVSDRRPLYYGFLTATFKGYASTGSEHGDRGPIQRLLDEG